MEHTNENNIICPYCDYEDFDSFEFNEGDEEWTCAACGEVMLVEMEIIIKYSTKKKQ